MTPHKKPNERICRFFKKHTEDEKHCPVNQGKRKAIYKEFKIPIVKLSTENMSLLLLNPPSNNVEFQKIIAKHTRDCYEIRQKNDRKIVKFLIYLKGCTCIKHQVK